MYATEAIIFPQIESLPIGDHLELAVQKSSQLCNVSNFTDIRKKGKLLRLLLKKKAKTIACENILFVYCR